MTTSDDTCKLDRRAFLRGIGVSAAAAPAAALGMAANPAEAAAPPDQPAGYQETEHVRRAYETARF